MERLQSQHLDINKSICEKLIYSFYLYKVACISNPSSKTQAFQKVQKHAKHLYLEVQKYYQKLYKQLKQGEISSGEMEVAFGEYMDSLFGYLETAKNEIIIKITQKNVSDKVRDITELYQNVHQRIDNIFVVFSQNVRSYLIQARRSVLPSTPEKNTQEQDVFLQKDAIQELQHQLQLLKEQLLSINAEKNKQQEENAQLKDQLELKNKLLQNKFSQYQNLVQTNLTLQDEQKKMQIFIHDFLEFAQKQGISLNPQEITTKGILAIQNILAQQNISLEKHSHQVKYYTELSDTLARRLDTLQSQQISEWEENFKSEVLALFILYLQAKGSPINDNLFQEHKQNLRILHGAAVVLGENIYDKAKKVLQEVAPNYQNGGYREYIESSLKEVGALMYQIQYPHASQAMSAYNRS